MLEQYDEILDINDLSEILKVGSSHAYKLVKEGEIRAFKTGKDWKIPKVSIINYIKEKSGLI